MKLIVQPDDGIAPLIDAIGGAQNSVEIVIFRFDETEMEEALKAAVERGIFVSALIAHANRGGGEHLRELELRFLDLGITVARTARDLVRYHDKMMLIDRSTLFLLSFNYTIMDINHSRGFGVVTQDRDLVENAQRLFDADARRQAYSPGLKTFLVSPLNARKELRMFIRGARRELLIYDPKISDPEMIRLLSERARAGVEIKIIGGLGRRADGLSAQKLSQMNLHTRTIIRDGEQAYIGSASLRKAELDSRREVGIIVREAGVIRGLLDTFQSDWRPAEADPAEPRADLEEVLEKTVQTIAHEIPPLATTVKKVVKRAVESAGPGALADKKVQSVVKKVVRKAVKETMKETLKEIAEESGPEPPAS